jgi:hypothetical protein
MAAFSIQAEKRLSGELICLKQPELRVASDALSLLVSCSRP